MTPNLNRLVDTFSKMNRDGFDTAGYLKWGFFFLDMSKERLLDVFKELHSSGYNLVSLEEKDNELWQLYVTKIDIMTPEKLHKRNIAFNELAQHCNIQLYDGWDVERVKV